VGLRGAERVFAVDFHADRLRIAGEFGGIPVGIDGGDPAEQIIEATGGLGADCGVDAVGYQAHEPSGQEHPEMVMGWLVQSVRTTGRLGVVGVYMPQDPGPPPKGRRTAGSASTSAGSSRRGRASAPGSARSSASTSSCAT
jgi:glutathione-independent formaldehyde dehydrogenase